MDFLQTIDWGFWTPEKTAALRNFLWIWTAVVGLFFLVWRARSADRSSKAALKQALASTKQLELAVAQQKLLSEQTAALTRQSEVAAKQFEISAKNLDESISQNYQSQLSDLIATLSDDGSTFSRAVALLRLREIALSRSETVNVITGAIDYFVQTTYPARSRELKEVTVTRFRNEARHDAEVLCNLPDAIWLELLNIHGSSIDHATGVKARIRDLLEEDENDEEAAKALAEMVGVYKALWVSIPKHHLRNAFLRLVPLSDREQALSTLSKIRDQYNWASCALTYGDLSGVHCAAGNYRDFFFNRSAVRAALFNECDFSGSMCVATDFSDTMFMNCTFENAYLRYADFKRCDLVDVVLTGANIDGADFRNCNGLTQAQIDSVSSARDTIFTDEDLVGRYSLKETE